MTQAQDNILVRVARGFAGQQPDLSAQDLEDIIQDARLRLLEREEQFPHQEVSKGMVSVITWRAGQDHARRERKHSRNACDLADLVTMDGEEWAEEPQAEGDQEYETRLGQLLERIVNDDREAYVAFFCIYQGLNARVCADETGMPERTIRAVLSTLRDRAREMGVV